MLDKVHYYNKSTKMIYIEVVKSSKRKKEANGSPEQIWRYMEGGKVDPKR